jgi:starvation-inducible DNA-binding protein
MGMFTTPSHLSEHARINVVQTLNARLADGLDLHGQIKVARWNVKGPQFPSLHPLFESFAVSLANHNDMLAERAVTLGGRAYGTVRHVASTSRLPEYPTTTTRDVEHCKLLADRIDLYLQGLRESRELAETHRDPTRQSCSPRSSPSSRSTRGSCEPRSRPDRRRTPLEPAGCQHRNRTGDHRPARAQISRDGRSVRKPCACLRQRRGIAVA